MTSRKGIYLDFTKKLIDGKFFGLTHQGPFWYAFGTHAEDIHYPTFEGYILQFELDSEGNMKNQKEIITGLDNGVHQICIWKNHLYILETYVQQITIVNLGDLNDKKQIHPFNRAISSWYKKNGLSGDCSKYLHMNAITVQDDRFYISCPHLKNAIIDGQPSQNKTISQIAMFGPDWKLIDIFDTGKYFCHDLVFVGHEIYFSAADNTICKLNIVTREVSVVYTVEPFSPDFRCICRGLSISEDGQVYVGTCDREGNDFLLNVITKESVKLESTSCCIKRIDGTDYNDETSKLRKSCTLTLPTDFNVYTRDIFRKLQDVHRKSEKPGTEIKDINSFLNPTLVNDEDLPNDINPSIVIKNLRDTVSLPSYFVESGPFYLYPAGHMINWHLNKEQMNQDGFLYRMYTVCTSGNSYFLYQHPISKKIHAIKDIDGTSLVFCLFPKFWHAVITMTGSRLSYGVKFTRETFLKELKLEDIWGEAYGKANIGPKSIRNIDIEDIPTHVEYLNRNFFRYELTGIKEDNIYDEESHDWRTDLLYNSSRKLVGIVQLSDSDDYEGGNIEVMNGQNPPRICRRDKNALILFPSFCPYRVTPVTRGTRKSLLFWVSGPPFV